MIDLKIGFDYPKFDGLPEELHDAIAEKLIDQTYSLYQLPVGENSPDRPEVSVWAHSAAK